MTGAHASSLAPVTVLAFVVWCGCVGNCAISLAAADDSCAAVASGGRFRVDGPRLLVDGTPTVLTGANAFHVYGGNSDVLAHHSGFNAVREFVGSVQSQPLEGQWAVQEPTTSTWLHPLAGIVAHNKAQGLVTIVDMHRWNESTETEFGAKTPSQTPWWGAYVQRLVEDFVPFVRARQDHVWLSPWNEPFVWDGADGATADDWYNEFDTIVGLIREAGGDEIVVVVPAAKQGQDEAPLLSHGRQLVDRHGPNVLFDVHAYQRWLTVSAEDVRARLAALRALDLAIVFGEVGQSNAGESMDASTFLQEATAAEVSVLAWVHKCSDSDPNALLGADCDGPNDNDNGNWGSKFLDFAAARADAPPGVAQVPSRQRRVFMHYVPWYECDGTRRGWCADEDAAGNSVDCSDPSVKQYVGRGPLIGEYCLDHQAVLTYHLLLAQGAGVDGLIVNVNPQWDRDMRITGRLVDALLALRTRVGAASFHQRLIFSFDDSSATTAADVRCGLELLRDRFVCNDTLATAGLLFVDDATARVPLLFWSDAGATEYRNQSRAVFGDDRVLVINRNAREFDVSDGNMQWVAPPVAADAPPDDWGQQYLLDFEWIMARQKQFGGTGGPNAVTLAVGAVWPGFNDANVPPSWNGGAPRYIPRSGAGDDGATTLELTFDAAVSRQPADQGSLFAVGMPWLQVVTFNDWPEGTRVEPVAVADEDDDDQTWYGYHNASFADLDTVHRYVRDFTAPGSADNSTQGPLALRAAAAWYDVRATGRVADSDAMLDLIAAGDPRGALMLAAHDGDGHESATSSSSGSSGGSGSAVGSAGASASPGGADSSQSGDASEQGGSGDESSGGSSSGGSGSSSGSGEHGSGFASESGSSSGGGSGSGPGGEHEEEVDAAVLRREPWARAVACAVVAATTAVVGALSAAQA